jgi:hypothetical protein
VQGSGLRYRVYGLDVRYRIRVEGSGFSFKGSRDMVSGFGFRVSGLGFRV